MTGPNRSVSKNYPRVAVLMPAYNADKFINRAVQSIAQSTLPCHLYIVDDGSKNPVAQVLSPDFKAHVLRLEKNGGIPRARNAGLRQILRQSYEFIACLDADDISYPERLAKQVDYLDRHPEVAAVGAWGRHIEETSGKTIGGNHPPASPDAVKRAMRSSLAIVNSSAMIRSHAFRAVGLYSEQYPAAEDYELFQRLSAAGFAIANLPEVLIDICISRQGISLKRRRRQLLDRLLIQWKYFEGAERTAWLGLIRTLLLFLVPPSLYAKIKSSQPYSGAAAFLRNKELTIGGLPNGLRRLPPR